MVVRCLFGFGCLLVRKMCAEMSLSCMCPLRSFCFFGGFSCSLPDFSKAAQGHFCVFFFLSQAWISINSVKSCFCWHLQMRLLCKMVLVLVLGSCRAGMAWKTAKSRKWKKKKMEIGMENSPKLDGAKNGKKMAQNGNIMENALKNPFLGHFFAIFAPVQDGAVFHFDFHFFFHFRLLAVFHAIPARQDPNFSLFLGFRRLSFCSGFDCELVSLRCQILPSVKPLY